MVSVALVIQGGAYALFIVGLITAIIDRKNLALCLCAVQVGVLGAWVEAMARMPS